MKLAASHDEKPMKKVIFACVHNAQAAGRVRGIRDDIRRRVAALIEAERWAPR